jgi:hypothetical protein
MGFDAGDTDNRYDPSNYDLYDDLDDDESRDAGAYRYGNEGTAGAGEYGFDGEGEMTDSGNFEEADEAPSLLDSITVEEDTLESGAFDSVETDETEEDVLEILEADVGAGDTEHSGNGVEAAPYNQSENTVGESE